MSKKSHEGNLSLLIDVGSRGSLFNGHSWKFKDSHCMTNSLPTAGQLERTLSQRIQALYRNQIGHRLDRVTCQLVDQKILIILENAVTPAEQLLVSNGKEDLVEEIHAHLDAAIQPQIIDLIQEVVGVSVVDLLSDAKLETERTGMIVMLDSAPRVSDRPVGQKAS
jgi:uncharacterized protein YbcI